MSRSGCGARCASLPTRWGTAKARPTTTRARTTFVLPQHATAPPEVNEAAREWAHVDKTSVAELETFVRRHGASSEADYARARIDNLKQQVAVAASPSTRPVAPPNADPTKPSIPINPNAPQQRPGAPTTADPTRPAFFTSPTPPARCEGVEAQVGNERRCLKPKDTFKDCPDCPEMVAVPAGEFMMGSDGNSDEKPVHKVTILKSFAVGKFEVTFAEWEACVAERACSHKPNDDNWGRNKRPAMNVSWDDIVNDYVPWLSRKTSKTYRLLTEAEWEYAARAGSRTHYAWGHGIAKNHANCKGCSSQWDNKETAPVGSFEANAFGLHDMHGNLWEWVADCYRDNYAKAPSDGTATPGGGGCPRVLRGGAWSLDPSFLRSATRFWSGPAGRSVLSGFRVARTLD